MKLRSALILCYLRLQLCSCFTAPGTPLSQRIFAAKTSRRYNFFKDLLDQAFENDQSLSRDKRKGQYDEPGEEFVDKSREVSKLTETQRRWRERNFQNDVIPEMIDNTSWNVALYLSGVPDRDPSNDLFGSKVNISSRDKTTGLALPDEASASLTIEFLEGGVCRASKSDFTEGERDGQWKLSDDGKMIRFSFDCVGYVRSVQTKGSIQKIYWSKEDEVTRQTSSSYTIPAGFVYADIEVSAGRQPGTIEVADDGVLRIEKEVGLLGAGSKMVPCGRFKAQVNA